MSCAEAHDPRFTATKVGLSQLLLIAAALLFTGSCEPGKSAGDFSVTDSVFNVGQSPLLVIGEGADSMDLFQVVGVEWARDAGVVLATAESRELLLFDSAGHLIRKAGGLGGGPGEFMGLSHLLQFRSDSLLAFDHGTWQFLVFSSALEYVRNFRIEQVGRPGFITPIGTLSDGTIIVYKADAAAAPRETGELRDYPVLALFSRHGPDGSLLDTLGTYQVDEVSLLSIGGKRVVSMKPFGGRTAAATSSSHLYLAPAIGSSVLEFTPQAKLPRTFQIPHVARRVTPNDRDAYGRKLQEEFPQDGIDAMFLQNLSFPDSFPAHGEIVPDICGGFWVQEYPAPTDLSERWLAFDSQGEWITSVTLPSRFALRRVGPDRLLGIQRDEDGVESIRVYSLTSAGRSKERCPSGPDWSGGKPRVRP